MKVNFEWNFEGILICSFTTIDTIDSMTNLGRENEEREFKKSTTEVEKGIISLQRGNPDPCRHERISDFTGLSRSSIGKTVPKLRSRGLVERTGSKRNGGWIVHYDG